MVYIQGIPGDYLEAMCLMLQQEEPDNYVIATGVARSVKEFVLEALKYAGLDLDIKRYVDYDGKMV
jgi:GDPmannose 4,6-dehydratase